MLSKIWGAAFVAGLGNGVQPIPEMQATDRPKVKAPGAKERAEAKRARKAAKRPRPVTASDINAMLKRAYRAAGSPDLLGGPLDFATAADPEKYEAWRVEQQKGVDAFDAALREEGKALR